MTKHILKNSSKISMYFFFQINLLNDENNILKCLTITYKCLVMEKAYAVKQDILNCDYLITRDRERRFFTFEQKYSWVYLVWQMHVQHQYLLQCPTSYALHRECTICWLLYKKWCHRYVECCDSLSRKYHSVTRDSIMTW